MAYYTLSNFFARIANAFQSINIAEDLDLRLEAYCKNGKSCTEIVSKRLEKHHP